MGSVFSVVLYGPDKSRMEAAADDAFEEVRRLDGMLSNYRPTSEWSKVNRLAATEPVRVSEELFSLLSACLEYSRRSEGAFDITVGPLMKIWGFYKGTGRLPHRAEVRGALAKVGYRYLELDRAASSMRFLRPGIEMDPGGIGKGYAVDRMVQILKRYDVDAALISAGGSTIFAMGTPPDEPGWRVKIRNPQNPEQGIEQVLLKNQSMSTSGTYEKFFTAEGKLYSHIMDPRTGWPAPNMYSVSVIAPSALDSEAWTKPVFINGREWSARHLPEGLRAFLCEDTGSRSGRARFGIVRTESKCEWLH
jgi:thiamine biosynthesis lipoprotein